MNKKENTAKRKPRYFFFFFFISKKISPSFGQLSNPLIRIQTAERKCEDKLHIYGWVPTASSKVLQCFAPTFMYVLYCNVR